MIHQGNVLRVSIPCELGSINSREGTQGRWGPGSQHSYRSSRLSQGGALLPSPLGMPRHAMPSLPRACRPVTAWLQPLALSVCWLVSME